jgi:carnitine O-acetyltransferase
MTDDLQVRPLPSLAASIGNYLENIKPLLSAEEFGRASLLCQEFMAEAGPELQQQLEAIASAPDVSNWNAGFWDSMYLTQREPLPIHSSPFFAVSDQDALAGLPIEAASARIISATSHVIAAIRDGSLAPEQAKGVSQDMVQYQRFFGYTREPAPGRDRKRFTLESNHICVVHNNQLFSLAVFDEACKPLPIEVLQANIKQIMGCSGTQESDNTFIGYLTAHERDSWAAAKDDIRRHCAENRRALEIIDAGLYVLCLDNSPVSSLRDRAEKLLHNRGDNRYFDKYQIVVFKDGRVGSIFEHAPVDAISVGRIWNETIKHLIAQDHPGPVEDVGEEHVELMAELKLDLPTTITELIEESRDRFQHLADTTQQEVVLFEAFGTDALKQLGVSPDACMQVMFHLSYLKAFGKIQNTYESVSTRQFREGRTDVLRSVTRESLDFAQSHNPSPDAASLALLKTATESIMQRRLISATGSSPDHHLSALYQLALQNQNNLFDYVIPPLFSDSTYTLYRRSILSTSNISDPLCLLFGFGPVTPEGLGLAYGTYPGHLVFHLSFFDQDRERINRFGRELQAALHYLQDLLVFAGVDSPRGS